MHKNIRCGEIAYDETTGRIMKYKNYPIGVSPFWGTADISKIKKWWEIRAVPASRHMMQDLIKKQGFLNAGAYLAKNLALSMTDTYWICPENMNLNYDEVKFINFAVYNSGRIPYYNATSYDPNASLGGQMEKYWDLSGSHPVLVKESYKYFGQQAVNEVFATLIHEKQDAGIPYVPYFAVKTEDNGILCKCSSFTNEHAELISACEMVENVRIRTALLSGIHVVFHAMNPDRRMREKYIGLAETSGVGEKTLYFMEDTVGSDYFENMSDWLKSDLPDTSEGWDNIVKDPLYEHNIDGDTSL